MKDPLNEELKNQTLPNEFSGTKLMHNPCVWECPCSIKGKETMEMMLLLLHS